MPQMTEKELTEKFELLTDKNKQKFIVYLDRLKENQDTNVPSPCFHQ